MKDEDKLRRRHQRIVILLSFALLLTFPVWFLAFVYVHSDVLALPVTTASILTAMVIPNNLMILEWIVVKKLYRTPCPECGSDCRFRMIGASVHCTSRECGYTIRCNLRF